MVFFSKKQEARHLWHASTPRAVLLLKGASQRLPTTCPPLIAQQQLMCALINNEASEDARGLSCFLCCGGRSDEQVL